VVLQAQSIDIIRLCDLDGEPIPGAQWSAIVGDKELTGTANDAGEIKIDFPQEQKTVKLKWNAPQSEKPEVFFEHELFLVLNDEDSRISNRLHNLGFLGSTVEEQVANYRKDFKYTPEIDDEIAFKEIIKWHDGGSMPQDKS
jgi:hypothetical protein